MGDTSSGPRETALLRAVHGRPGLTRADAARELGLGTGSAAALVGRLSAAQLVVEAPRALVGVRGRGRPSQGLWPHPRGPLVLAAALTHGSWHLQVVQIGGDVLAEARGPVSAGAGEVMTAMARAAASLRRRFPRRVRGLGLAVPGTVRNGRILDAVGLGWRDVDLRAVWPRGLVRADNDASVAALAESRRGAAVDAELALHLRVEVGLGGALVHRGTLLAGASGTAGEFGHMPFGDPRVSCACGARGCWGTSVDGGALARVLHEEEPADPLDYAHRIVGGSRAGGSRERRAVRAVAVALGRGTAGLVNGLDPDVVTFGGLGSAVLQAETAAVHEAFHAGLMQVRRSDPPPLRASSLGEDGLLTGAAELVWDDLWPQLRTRFTEPSTRHVSDTRA